MGVLEHRVHYATQRALRHRVCNTESRQTKLILLDAITNITTNFLQVFHALYIGTWEVTAEHEPLSLIIVLFVMPSLRPYLSFHYALHLIVLEMACPLRFIRSASAFHTCSSEVGSVIGVADGCGGSDTTGSGCTVY